MKQGWPDHFEPMAFRDDGTLDDDPLAFSLRELVGAVVGGVLFLAGLVALLVLILLVTP